MTDLSELFILLAIAVVAVAWYFGLDGARLDLTAWWAQLKFRRSQARVDARVQELKALAYPTRERGCLPPQEAPQACQDAPFALPVLAGTSIDETAQQAYKMAQWAQKPVVFCFNGTVVVCEPHHTVDQIMTTYWKQRPITPR